MTSSGRISVGGDPQHRAPRELPRRVWVRAGVAAAAAVAITGATLAVMTSAGASAHSPGGSQSDALGQGGTGAQDGSYSFSTLNNNNDTTFNQLLGVNNEGLIAGYFGSGAAGHPNQGYQLAPPHGQADYTSENFPGSVQTQVTGLNDRGVTVGFWSGQNNASNMNDNFGFYASGGQFHQVNFPVKNPATPPVDQLLGVNDQQVAVGFYTNAQGLNRGYEYNITTRQFSRVLLPGIPNLSKKVTLTATAISNSGDVAGFYSLSGGTTTGFLLAGGHATQLAFPGAAMTQPFGVNDAGEVAGAYTTGTGSSAATHGFTWTARHGFTTVDDPSGTGTTTINGVSDRGDLAGFYTDTAGNTDGFLATPATGMTRHLDLQAMPAGTVTLGTSGGQLTAQLATFGLTPGSSHAVDLTGPDGTTVMASFTPLTATSTGQGSQTLTSTFTGTIPDGSRVVIRNGTGTDTTSAEPIAQTPALHGAGAGTTAPLTAVEVTPGGTSPATPHGHATITYDPAAKTLTVTVDASGLTPGPHAAHIHLGSCQSQGAVQYMLTDLTANPQGQIIHQTRTITGVTSPIPATGWYLNLHQGNSNNILSNGQPTIQFRPLLCANI